MAHMIPDRSWLSQLSRTPRVPMSTWHVTTPAWAVLVTHRGGRIVGIDPLLRRQWRGKSWDTFRAWVKATWPGQWEARRLLH